MWNIEAHPKGLWASTMRILPNFEMGADIDNAEDALFFKDLAALISFFIASTVYENSIK